MGSWAKMNVPLSGEDAKAYFLRQERHWSAQAAAALGADSDSDEDLDDKKRDRRDKKRMLVLKKKARELSDAAFANASSSVPPAQDADALRTNSGGVSLSLSARISQEDVKREMEEKEGDLV